MTETKVCPRCGQTRPITTGPAARAWDILHSEPGSIRMTWRELKGAKDEFAISGNRIKACIAAGLSGESDGRGIP